MRGDTSIDAVGLLVTIVTIGIVVTVGLSVADTIRDEQVQALEEQDVEHLCAGFYGCDGSVRLADLVLLIVLLVAMSLMIGTPARLAHRGQNIDNGPDAESLVIDSYIDPDGDIETVLELEDELEDALDGDEVDS